MAGNPPNPCEAGTDKCKMLFQLIITSKTGFSQTPTWCECIMSSKSNGSSSLGTDLYKC